MDQLPFDIKLTIIGCEIDMFYNLLLSGGFDQQAKDFEEQIKEQLRDTTPKADELSIGAVVERLVAFQNFLILDGQLDIEPDEVEKNAVAFTKAT